MHSFEFYVPTQVVFGEDSVQQVAALVKKHGGSRVLVVSGGSSAKRSGLLDRVFSLLQAAEIPFDSISGVQPNPRVALAREGVQKALALGADMILAVGGGSVIDTCKAIAHGTANPGVDLWEFWKRRQPLTKSLPIGVILTIPAAGSECSDSAVLTNEEDSEKRGLNTDLNRPAFAILDPSLASTLPKRQVACGVSDIMLHTLERYFTPVTGNALTDEIAEALLRTVVQFGERVYQNPGDMQAMSEIMWCGSLSHNNLTGLGRQKDFSAHQLGHTLGEKFDVLHGESLTATWGSWARYVYKTDIARFARYARKVWNVREPMEERAALAGILATEDFFQKLHMPLSFTALGIGKQDEAGLDDLALRCSYQKTRTIGTFQMLGYDDIRLIYQAANH